MKILMLGSCIARDVIDVGLDRGVLAIPTCFARSSIASLSSQPAIDEPLLKRIASPYQERCVRADMDKSFLQVLEKEEFDIFLIDLAEERFPLLENDKGQLLTLSDEYVAHAEKPFRGTLIEGGTARYYEKWHQGWYQIETILKQRNFFSKIRVLEFFLTNRINNGELISKSHHNPFARQNELLRSHYDFFRKNLSPECIVSFSPELLVADQNHKWGLSPMHYISSMKEYALEQILHRDRI